MSKIGYPDTPLSSLIQYTAFLRDPWINYHFNLYQSKYGFTYYDNGWRMEIWLGKKFVCYYAGPIGYEFGYVCYPGLVIYGNSFNFIAFVKELTDRVKLFLDSPDMWGSIDD